MNQKLRNINICKVCGVEYERGFYGTGPVYCSHKCNRIGRAAVDKLRLRKSYVRKDKDCLVCGRSILKVGLRKHANKYCSKKCMFTANKVRVNGQKTIRVRIPIESMKTITIPISELPRLFKR